MNVDKKINFNEIFDRIVCINLKHRVEKKGFMLKQAKDYNLDINFFEAVALPNNPARGCLLSHLEIIKQAKNENLTSILILEDDCKFLREDRLPAVPDDWDMLYLGGNIDAVYDNTNPDWVKGAIWTTHSYAISNSIFDLLITELEKYDKEVDKFYKQHIHTKYNCYVLKNFLTTQKMGYSDIEKRPINYDIDRLHCDKPFDFADHEIMDGNSYKYKLKLNYPENLLPYISIITPTYNRKNLFNIWISNYNRIDYPKNKIEFIIIDDGNDNLRSILPNDIRIKYIKIQTENNQPLTIGRKRNLGVKYANYNIIVHMDDDDYYPSYSVKTRVKILLQNRTKSCVGCTQIGCYDIYNKTSFSVNDTRSLNISEASMAYTREFFEERKYNENIEKGEGSLMIRGRESQIIQIPYIFVLIALTHKQNLTKDLRVYKKKDNEDESYVFFETFPTQFREIILKLIR